MSTLYDLVHQMNQILKKIEKSKELERLKAKTEELFNKTGGLTNSSTQKKVNHILLCLKDAQSSTAEIRNVLQSLRGQFTKENPNGDRS